MIEFAFMTPEEKALGRIADFYEVPYAHEDGRVLSFIFLTKENQYVNCSNCRGRCVQGFFPWTVPDRRGEGIFSNLFAWAQEEMGFDKIYGGGSLPREGEPIYWKYNIMIPENNPIVDESTYVPLSQAADPEVPDFGTGQLDRVRTGTGLN